MTTTRVAITLTIDHDDWAARAGIDPADVPDDINLVMHDMAYTLAEYDPVPEPVVTITQDTP